jgi:hypothetical protein
LFCCIFTQSVGKLDRFIANNDFPIAQKSLAYFFTYSIEYSLANGLVNIFCCIFTQSICKLGRFIIENDFPVVPKTA